MKIFDPGKLRKVKWSEYALRFAGGGIISVIAALMDRKYGHMVGGAFMAFPAILPASLTLTCKKEGTGAGMQHEWGAYFGAIGLLAFAAVVWALAGTGGWALPAALLAWVVVAFGGLAAAIGWAGAARGDEPQARTSSRQASPQ